MESPGTLGWATLSRYEQGLPPLSPLPPLPPVPPVPPPSSPRAVNKEEGSRSQEVPSSSSYFLRRASDAWAAASEASTAWASEASTVLAATASQASVAAAPLAEQALSTLRDTAAAAADAAASAASQASESVHESAVRARQNAEVAIRINTLRAEIGILESHIEQWKKEWGLLCFDHFFEGDLAECTTELYRIKQTIYELAEEIRLKQVRIRGFEEYGLAYQSLLKSALGKWRERGQRRAAEAQRVHALELRAAEHAPVSTLRQALRQWHRLRVPRQSGGCGTVEVAALVAALATAALAVPLQNAVPLPMAIAVPEDSLPLVVVGVPVAPPAAAVQLPKLGEAR